MAPAHKNYEAEQEDPNSPAEAGLTMVRLGRDTRWSAHEDQKAAGAVRTADLRPKPPSRDSSCAKNCTTSDSLSEL